MRSSRFSCGRRGLGRGCASVSRFAQTLRPGPLLVAFVPAIEVGVEVGGHEAVRSWRADRFAPLHSTSLHSVHSSARCHCPRRAWARLAAPRAALRESPLAGRQRAGEAQRTRLPRKEGMSARRTDGESATSITVPMPRARARAAVLAPRRSHAFRTVTSGRSRQRRRSVDRCGAACACVRAFAKLELQRGVGGPLAVAVAVASHCCCCC